MLYYYSIKFILVTPRMMVQFQTMVAMRMMTISLSNCFIIIMGVRGTDSISNGGKSTSLRSNHYLFSFRSIKETDSLSDGDNTKCGTSIDTTVLSLMILHSKRCDFSLLPFLLLSLFDKICAVA